MARLPTVRFRLRGVGWNRMQERLKTQQINAKQMAASRWIIGSNLPYASHWIEEGWRQDPRYGRVEVRYRTPATYYMRGAVDFMYNPVRRRAASGPVGIRIGGAMMQLWAEKIAENMRALLLATVYSQPIPTRGGTPRWMRTYKLFYSIRAYRA